MHKSPNHPTAYRFKPCLTEHSFHASTTHSTSTNTTPTPTRARARTRTTSTTPSTNTTTLIHFPISDAEYLRFFEDAADAMSKSKNPKQPQQEKRNLNSNITNQVSGSTTSTSTSTSPNSTTPPKPKRVATWIHIPQETTTTTTPTPGTPTPGKILGHCPVPACGYTTTSRRAYEDHITGAHSLKVVRVSDFFPCPHPKCCKRSHADAVYTARGGGGDGAGQQVPVCTHEMIVHVDYPASHRSYYSTPRF